MYQFNSVAWEPKRQSSIRSKKSTGDHREESIAFPQKSPTKSRDSKKRPSHGRKPKLSPEQQQIADEIKDFLHRQKSSRSFSSSLSGSNRGSKSQDILLQSPTTPKSKSRKGHNKNNLSMALAGLPSTPKSKPKRKTRADPFSSPYSAQSNRSLPVARSQPLVPITPQRSTRTLPSAFSKFDSPDSFADNGLMAGWGYESDRAPDPTTRATKLTEREYFSDANAPEEKEVCLFSEYFSDASDIEDENDDDPASSPRSNRHHPASFSWNVFAKSRANRHQPLRASSPVGGEKDVSHLLGGAIFGRHGTR